MSKNIIFMISIQEDKRSQNQKHYWSIKSWKQWAAKNNAQLFVLTENILSPPQWNKIMIFDLLEDSNIDYNRILYVDADTIVHPNMPNIFETLEEGYFYGVRNFGSMDWVIRSIENYSFFIFNNHQLDWEKYINTGFMLFDKTHKQLFDYLQGLYQEKGEELAGAEKLGVGKDQPCINFALDILNIPRKFLPYEYNMQDLLRSELLGGDFLFTKYGWIYHFNCGVKPTPGFWMEETLKYLNNE